LSETAAIVLAAGKSTRMKSDLPKVLHEICGRPMLGFVLDACRRAGVDRLIVVVGHGKQQVRDRFETFDGVTWVEQPEQKGTGHAVCCCQEALAGFSGSVLVVAGDMPLVCGESLVELLQRRVQSGDALSLATTELNEPAGYGRIVRDSRGRLTAIVEDRDCTDQQRAIREVNPSYYCFEAESLWQALDRVTPHASSGEVFLTETVRVLKDMGRKVSADVPVAAEDATGINTRLDLATVNRLMQDRIQLSLMNDGVTIVDPDNTWIDSGVTIGRSTTIYPFSFIGTGARIGEGCRIGPFACLTSGATVPSGTACGSVDRRGAGL